MACSDDAVAFLYLLRPEGVHNLVAIDLRGAPPVGITRPLPAGEPDLRRFIERYFGCNLYYSPNPPLADSPDRKLAKRHIAEAEYLFVDVDPDPKRNFTEERKQIANQARTLLASEHPPTFVVDSGNGVQHLWRVEGLAIEEAEARNRGLAQLCGADPTTWNADRILRLPGTINRPDARKRALGRSPRPARLLKRDTGRCYADPSFAPFLPPAPKGATTDEPATFDWAIARACVEWSDLPEDLRKHIGRASETDEDFAARWRGDTSGLGDPSRSGLAFALATHMKRLGFEDQDIANAIHSHSDLKGVEWTERELRRAVSRAPGRWDRGNALTAEQIASVEASEAKRPAYLRRLESTVPAEPNRKRRLLRVRLRDAKPRLESNYLVKGLLGKGTLAVMYGEPNAGKSFLALRMAQAVALGELFNGMRAKQAPVLYFATEAGGSFESRAYALKTPEDAPSDYPLEFIPTPIDLLHNDEDLGAVLEAIEDAGREYGVPVGLIGVDTLARAMAGGNESASEDMGAVIKRLDVIRDRCGCSVLVVHHPGKDPTRGARGWSGLRAAVDTELEVLPPDREGRRIHKMIVRKQRDLPYCRPIEFALETVSLGKDDEGDDVTSCLVRCSGDAVFEAIRADESKLVEVDMTDEDKMFAAVVEAEKFLVDAGHPIKDGIHENIILAMHGKLFGHKIGRRKGINSVAMQCEEYLSEVYKSCRVTLCKPPFPSRHHKSSNLPILKRICGVNTEWGGLKKLNENRYLIVRQQSNAE